MATDQSLHNRNSCLSIYNPETRGIVIYSWINIKAYCMVGHGTIESTLSGVCHEVRSSKFYSWIFDFGFVVGFGFFYVFSFKSRPDIDNCPLRTSFPA